MRLEIDVQAEGMPEFAVQLLNRVMAAALAEEGLPDKCAAYMRIVDDAAIREINRDNRGLDAATDVLSFPSCDFRPQSTARDNIARLRREYDIDMGGYFLGDIIISIEHARAQALEYGHSLQRELGYLCAHSLFHLMGYDHMNEPDKLAMRTMEEKAMRRAELSRDAMA